MVVTGIEGDIYMISTKTPQRGNRFVATIIYQFTVPEVRNTAVVYLWHTLTQSKLFLQTFGASGARPFLAQVLCGWMWVMLTCAYPPSTSHLQHTPPLKTCAKMNALIINGLQTLSKQNIPPTAGYWSKRRPTHHPSLHLSHLQGLPFYGRQVA